MVMVRPFSVVVENVPNNIVEGLSGRTKTVPEGIRQGLSRRSLG